MTDDTFLIDGKDCDTGYYCTGGALIPYPTDKDTMGGDICQPGFYCELGSTDQTPCEGGTYEPRTGSYKCQNCPEGYYCP